MKKHGEFDANKDLDPYKSDKFSKIPSWIKILLLKFWVAGATFFFFGIANPLVDPASDLAPELYFICISLGMGLFTEYITKNIVRHMKNSRDNTYYYNMINRKGILSLVLNILYGFLTVFPIVYISGFLASKGLMLNFFGGGSSGIEPIENGIMYLIVDFIFLFIKNASVNAYKKHKFQKEEKIAQRIINSHNESVKENDINEG